jgi:hypothetical protein
VCPDKCDGVNRCFFDPTCSTSPGVGCNAGGKGQDCRFCDTGGGAPACPAALLQSPTTAGGKGQDCAGATAADAEDAKATSGTSYTVDAYCGPSWLSDCSLVPSGWGQIVGAFQTDASATPPAAGGSAADNYIALGGDNVGGSLPDASTFEGWTGTSNAANIEFDMEGLLESKFDEAKQLADSVKSLAPGTKAQMACLASPWDDGMSGGPSGVQESFDTFSLMLYASTMNGGGWSIPEEDPRSGSTYKAISLWMQSSIPNSKIILGMTTAGLEAYMVDFFKELIQENGFRGLFVWKIKDLASTGIAQECISNPDVSCSAPAPSPTPSPSTCSARCTAGDAEGQCCDTGSTTTIGSCTQLGQEGCCGDSSATESLCQLV